MGLAQHDGPALFRAGRDAWISGAEGEGARVGCRRNGRVGRGRRTRFKPGDEVYGTARGSFAEFVCANEDRIALKPANLTFEQAAAVPTAAITALQGLRDKGGLRAGQHVLVLGAGGGVGSFAVQIAKAYGAHVTGVCSTAKVDLVRSLGADEVIDYTKEMS